MSIYAALDAARAEFPPIVKNRTNPHFKSRYADLEAILDAVEPVLRRHDLVVTQVPGIGVLQTFINLKDGSGYIEGAVELPTDVKPQELGSALTYARRYALVTMLGLVTEDDDDGEGATASAPAQGAQRSITPAREPQPDRAPTPEGWISDQDCVQAHNDLFERIILLPEDERAKCKAFRDENGWPMAVAKFNVLKAQVEKVERAAADSVAAAFPGAEPSE